MARRRRLGGLLGVLATGALAVVVASVDSTQAGWTTGTVAATGSALTGSTAVTVGYQSTTCSAGPRVSSAACTGSLAPTSSPPANASATITNAGNLGSGQLAQTVSAASCAPARFANAKTAADPMLPRYATSFQAGDPWGSTSAVSLGPGAYAADVAATNSGSLGTSYSLGVWFRVPNGYTAGGGLLSLAGSPASSTSAASSPALWMDGAGKIRYYLGGTLGTSTAGASTAAYNDGQWHLAVLSVGVVVVAVPSLYVDGSSATSAGLAALSSTTGYWHVGWADFASISSSPSSALLGGSLSGAFVSSSSMSSTTMASLVGSTSAADYQGKVLALSGLAHLWMLDDAGTATYTGSLPSSMTSPCGQVNVGLAFSSPAGTVASQSLADFVTSGGSTIAAPGSGATQNLTVSTSKGTGYNADIAGLRLVVPLTLTHATMPGGRWPLALTWSTASGVFLG